MPIGDKVLDTPETVEKRLATWTGRREAAGRPPLQRFETYAEYRAAGRKSFNISRQRKRHENGVTIMGSEEHRKKQAEKQRAYLASLSDEQRQAISGQRRGKPGANLGRKFGPQSPERRAQQSARLKAYIASLTPEQRQARMIAARDARRISMAARG